jgi:hypothetical protein
MRIPVLLALLISSAALAQTPATIPPLSQAEKRAVVEKAGALLTATYIFPERAAAAKAKIDAALLAREYETLATPEAFADRLTRDLQ